MNKNKGGRPKVDIENSKRYYRISLGFTKERADNIRYLTEILRKQKREVIDEALDLLFEKYSNQIRNMRNNEYENSIANDPNRYKWIFDR